MRKEYRRAIRAQFTETLAERFPDFEPVRLRAPTLGGGESVYESSMAPLTFFLILMPSPTGQQAFTVEIGWSVASRFPEITARPSLVLESPGDLPEADEGIIRIGNLTSGHDRWWSLPDPAVENPGSLEALQRSLEPIEPHEATATVAPLVADAVDLLERVGTPFMSRLSQDHGIH